MVELLDHLRILADRLMFSALVTTDHYPGRVTQFTAFWPSACEQNVFLREAHSAKVPIGRDRIAFHRMLTRGDRVVLPHRKSQPV